MVAVSGNFDFAIRREMDPGLPQNFPLEAVSQP